MGLLTVLVTLYLSRFQPALAQSLPKIAGVCLLVVVTLAVGLILSRSPWFAMLIPLTVTVMVLTIAYNPQFALLMAYSLSLAMTVALDADLSQLLVQMGGLATAVLLLQQVRTRFVAPDELNDLPNNDLWWLNINTPADFARAQEINETLNH